MVTNCAAELSCSNSNFYYSQDLEGAEVYSLWCRADRSCMDSYIRANTGVDPKITGHLGAYNTTFISEEHGELGIRDIDLKIDFAGDAATIICGLNANCTINCYGTGCIGLNFSCSNNSKDCVINCIDDQMVYHIKDIENEFNYRETCLTL